MAAPATSGMNSPGSTQSTMFGCEQGRLADLEIGKLDRFQPDAVAHHAGEIVVIPAALHHLDRRIGDRGHRHARPESAPRRHS